ncbi:Protein S100-A1 S-100 protein alpha chain S-100 protein subunit alpha [Channa argus]|uniref:Protein S100-A1 S-100 protein alpha chain S-100 protein subunit alpha n=1 Tax=Channa argus TaxID=215402 RepID=A0A6G1PQ33_CHAAH|nr:Protein S100-A1 S-100 protein alpha chain S-100 protein subunit alpha [Channa argus]KAK2909698.1 hypothetical protein Q8A73_007413 [Channa argus]
MDIETNKGVASLMYLIKIFDDYASKDQDKDHLSKAELKTLLSAEFSLLIQGAKPEDVNKIMGALDHDKDGQVDIQEYMFTLCSLGIAMHGGIGQFHKKK